MNEEELKNLIVAKDLELYKARQELHEVRSQLALAQKEVKELTSYLDQLTTPVEEIVTPEPVKNEKKDRSHEVKFRKLTEDELLRKYKNGQPTSVPYWWYHSRGLIVPDWARELCYKYVRTMKQKRNSK